MFKIQNIDSFKKLVKNNYHWIALFFIVLLGLSLRLINIDKPGGLWQDEIEGYTGASMSFPFGILDFIKNNGVHPPLYYFLLHFWISIFGNEDLYLRLFSVFSGVLTIIAGYFIGNQIKSKNLGLVTALFIAVNGLLIYYSQEVRFYSLFIFFISLSTLFLLRIYSNPDRKNFIGLAVSNILCLYTSSLAIVFIGLQAIIYSIYLFIYNRNSLKSFIITTFATGLTFLPYTGLIIRQYGIANNGFISIFEWARFTPACLIYPVQDWFNPIIINIVNYPHFFYHNLLLAALSESGIYFVFVTVFFFLPAALCILGVVKSVLSKDKRTIIILLIAISFFIIEIILTLSGKMALISRYTLPSGFLLLLLATYGLNEIKKTVLKRVVISSYILICLFTTVFHEKSAPKIERGEGVRYAAYLLDIFNIQPDDIVIMPYCGRYVKKYDKYHINYRVIDFDTIDTFYFPDKNKLGKIFDQSIINKINKNNAYDTLFTYITNKDVAKPLNKYFTRTVLKKLKPGSRVLFVVTRGVCFYPEEILISYKSNKTLYRQQSIGFMLASKNFYDLLKLCHKNLKITGYNQHSLWEVYVFSPDTSNK